jgi:hypothetical protein
MPIITLQRRSRELGRIRTGQVVPGKNGGRGRPTKLDRFRLTSPSKELLEKVAALYGGTVEAWTPQNGGPQQWEVVTEATRLPVLVPPQPVSQYYELWSGGGCARRCDGQRELLGDTPCICAAEDPDPAERECKPTTRLNVVLAEVEGIGVWRLESHGYYAATELPEVAEFLARAQGYVSAWLTLEERVIKRNGETKRFLVPALEVDITPAELLSGGGRAALATAPETAALTAGAVKLDMDSWLSAVAAATSREELLNLRQEAARGGLQAADVDPILKNRAEELGAAQPAPPADPDAAWQQILRAVPADWTTQQVEDDFARVTGVDAGVATAEHMATYFAEVMSR